jgi:hypothetical protein
MTVRFLDGISEAVAAKRPEQYGELKKLCCVGFGVSACLHLDILLPPAVLPSSRGCSGPAQIDIAEQREATAARGVNGRHSTLTRG